MIENVRDVVLIVVGITWSIITLAILAVTVVASVLILRYLTLARVMLGLHVRPVLESAEGIAELVRERTATLPHYGSGQEVLGAPRHPVRPVRIRLPFLRRRRPWYQRVLGR